MCNRVTLRVPVHELTELFDGLSFPALAARFNIGPTQLLPMVALNNSGQRECRMARWGLLPAWSGAAGPSTPMFNARAETIDVKPAFREAFKKRRCLIPVDGFYEWEHRGKRKQPYLFTLKNERPFALTGLWEPASGALPETCTIVTTEANSLVAPLHDRMPVMLTRASFEAWLDPARTTRAALSPLLTPFPAELMEAREVDRFVSDVRNEGARCIEPPHEPATLWDA